LKFEITILGSGAAAPTLRRRPTSQLVNVREKYFLVDCGEGTQIQMRKLKVKFQKINHVLISHLHGDHFFGLIGLISTMHLLGRTRTLYIFGPAGLKEVIDVQLRVSETYLNFIIDFTEINHKKSEVIYENSELTITTIPLKHRINCTGFLFKEKKKPRKIIKEKVVELNIPVVAYAKLKVGDDFVDEDGKVFKNSELTKDAEHSYSYAYCSDTAYYEKVVDIIKGVDVLYHESTFLDDLKKRAKETFHSTSKDAAKIANKAEVSKLILGHFSARYKEFDLFLKEAEEEFPNTILAEDGMVIRLY